MQLHWILKFKHDFKQVNKQLKHDEIQCCYLVDPASNHMPASKITHNNNNIVKILK